MLSVLASSAPSLTPVDVGRGGLIVLDDGFDLVQPQGWVELLIETRVALLLIQELGQDLLCHDGLGLSRAGFVCVCVCVCVGEKKQQQSLVQNNYMYILYLVPQKLKCGPCKFTTMRIKIPLLMKCFFPLQHDKRDKAPKGQFIILVTRVALQKQCKSHQICVCYTDIDIHKKTHVAWTLD